MTVIDAPAVRADDALVEAINVGGSTALPPVSHPVEAALHAVLVLLRDLGAVTDPPRLRPA